MFNCQSVKKIVNLLEILKVGFCQQGAHCQIHDEGSMVLEHQGMVQRHAKWV